MISQVPLKKDNLFCSSSITRQNRLQTKQYVNCLYLTEKVFTELYLLLLLSKRTKIVIFFYLLFFCEKKAAVLFSVSPESKPVQCRRHALRFTWNALPQFLQNISLAILVNNFKALCIYEADRSN